MMTTTQACGVGYGLALVTVATVAAVWHTKWCAHRIVALFARGDR